MGSPVSVRPGYQASSLVVSARPDEMGFPLREDEFQILREGEVSEARAGRDLCIASCLTAVLGLLGIIATADWTPILQQQRKLPFAICSILFGIAAGCGAGSVIYHRRVVRTRNNSAYSHLVKQISEWFAKTGALDRDEPDAKLSFPVRK
jgi:hypothetical protein